MNLRKDRRADIECPVSFTGENVRGAGATVNVSTQGCAIRSDTRVEPETYLALSIGFPEGQAPLPVDMAVVRWTRHSEFGVHFVAMAEGDRDRLRRILARIEGTDRMKKGGPS